MTRTTGQQQTWMSNLFPAVRILAASPDWKYSPDSARTFYTVVKMIRWQGCQTYAIQPARRLCRADKWLFLNKRNCCSQCVQLMWQYRFCRANKRNTRTKQVVSSTATQKLRCLFPNPITSPIGEPLRPRRMRMVLPTWWLFLHIPLFYLLRQRDKIEWFFLVLLGTKEKPRIVLL